MSTPLGIIHSDFGRVVLARLDQSMVQHAHRECHLILKVSGPDIIFSIKKSKHVLTNASLLLVNAWEPHFYEHETGSEPVTLLTFYFKPQWLKAVDRQFALSGHPKFFSQASTVLSTRGEELRDDILALLTGFSVPNHAMINQLMAEAFQTFTHSLTLPTRLYPAGGAGELGYDSRIRQVVDYLIDHHGLCSSLETLAKSVGLSRAQFFRLFSRSTGMAPATCINMLKMEYCLQDVVQFDIPIQDIAERMGYFPQGNFTRFFVSQQGVSPSHYRRTIVAI